MVLIVMVMAVTFLVMMAVMFLVMMAMLVVVPMHHGLPVDVMHHNRFPIDTLYHHRLPCVDAMDGDGLPLAVVGSGDGGSGGAAETASKNRTRATADFRSHKGTQGTSQCAAQDGIGGEATGKNRGGGGRQGDQQRND